MQAKTPAPPHRPETLARNDGARPKPVPKHTHTRHSQEWRGCRETRTQTQAPHKSRKPSVHSLGTEAARSMQVTRANQVQRPGPKLHPKACAALGIEAERATPKHFGNQVPRTCMHALGTGYARKPGETLGFQTIEGTCASTGAHPPGMTSTSRWRPSALPVLPRATSRG